MVEYEVRKEGMRAKARITRVDTKKASEVFKNTKNPQQLLLEVHANVEGNEIRIATIPKPPSRFISPKSRMAAFLQKYKKPPEPGLVVEAVTNAKGFWTLVL